MVLSVAILVALVFGAALGLLMRRLMGRRVRLGWAEAVLSGIVGSELGIMVLAIVRGGYAREHWPGALLASVVSTVIVMSILATSHVGPNHPRQSSWQPGEPRPGVQVHRTLQPAHRAARRQDRTHRLQDSGGTGQPGGGDLLIGVEDDGTATRARRRPEVHEEPDYDRYELWLRDHLSRTLLGRRPPQMSRWRSHCSTNGPSATCGTARQASSVSDPAKAGGPDVGPRGQPRPASSAWTRR